jgi:hypothetical protein
MEDTLTSLTSLELVVKIKRSTYNKERYEANKDYILKYRKDRYASLNKKQYGIKVQTGEYVLNFD